VKKGDLVRFKAPYWFPHGDHHHSEVELWIIGLLISYEPWEKMTTVLYGGELLRIAARNVQKAGKRDCNATHVKVI
jgi:hypothetical protein|tara:strand:+ start:221 stop:448 length:228 start_codon:yes stop_codon:yes gene_type:complete